MFTRSTASLWVVASLVGVSMPGAGCSDNQTSGGSGGAGASTSSGGGTSMSCESTPAASCPLQDHLSDFVDPLYGRPPVTTLEGVGLAAAMPNGDIVALRESKFHGGLSSTTVWRFEHGGTAWKEVDDPSESPTDPYQAYSLLLDPAGRLFSAGTHFSFPHGQIRQGREAIRRSDDGGTTWKEVFSDPKSGSGDLVAAGCVIYAGFASSIRRSTDGGDSWEIVFDGAPNAMLALDDGTIVAIINTHSDRFNVVHGTAPGTWVQGAPVGFPAAIATDGTAVYAVEDLDPSGWTVRKSTDQGGSWIDLEAYHGEVNPPVSCAPDEGVVEPEQAANIVATKSGGIVVTGSAEENDVCNGYRVARFSNDGGGTWTSLLPDGSGADDAQSLRLLADGSIELSAYSEPTTRLACK